jgi:hypothetical protein
MAAAWAVCAINRVRRLSGRGPQAVSVRGGGLRRQHIEMRGPAGADPPVRGRQRHADPLQGPAQTQGLGLRDRQAINDAQSASCSGSPPGDHHARDAARRDGFRVGLSPRNPRDRRPNPAPMRSDARGREQTTAPILLHAANLWPTAISTKPPCTQPTPSSAKRARRERRHPNASKSGRTFRP